MKTALITAVGSASAGAVNAGLRKLGYRVVGCDIYPQAWNLVSNEVDVFFQAVPATDSEAYLAQLLEVVEREGVEYLIPLTDVEVDVLCSQQARFALPGRPCTLCIPREAAARLCRNKLAMAEALEKDGLCHTIPTFSPYGYEPKEGDFPLMLKPLHGRSSQGQAVVHTRQAFFSALEARRDYIAQPFLAGDVYTVDLARDAFGQVRALVRQELLRTVNGLGTTVRMLPGHPLEEVCATIAARLDLVGVVNMEFIRHGDRYHFLEVNPRFSGGVGFSVLAGMDFVAHAMACYQGKALNPAAPIREMTLTRRVEPVITQG